MKPFLTARWQHLLMLNFEADPAVLEQYLPKGTELDDYAGRHFVSIVGFQFVDARLRGITFPFHRHFGEVNLRFYVRRREGNQCRRGVVFIKEAVPRRAIAWVANWFYDEHFVVERVKRRLVEPMVNKPGSLEYHCRRFAFGAEFDGNASPPVPGGDEEFIAEHYWGYTRRRDGTTSEYEVRHPSWRVHPVRHYWLTGDVIDFYGGEYRSVLGKPPCSVFVAVGSVIEVYPGVRLDS